jgi:hypothetical protein
MFKNVATDFNCYLPAKALLMTESVCVCKETDESINEEESVFEV